jgi:Toxin co-regulated pilus biosynthesis protein Q
VKRTSYVLWILAFVAVGLGLSACATSSAPGVNGRWRPANQYAEVPQEIPLYESYVYYAAPLDSTLKTMLTRWAKDSKMTLSYLHPSDFTLHLQAAQVQTTSLQDAVTRLSNAYAAQRVSITAEQNQIVVRVAGDATTPAMSP